jgi:hypothetical protein
LRERLFLDGEDYETKRHEKIFVFKAKCALLGGELQHSVDRLIVLAQRGAPEMDLWAAVRAIVPECSDALPLPLPDATPQARPSPEQRFRPVVAS